MQKNQPYNRKYPSVPDLAARARRRIPGFAMDYLEGGIGGEFALRRNRQDLDDVLLWPRYLRDMSQVDCRCRLFGHDYDLGVGISPVGLGGMMWPGIEMCLAQASQEGNIPYVLSTMSTTPLEQIAKTAPDVAWFQLYVPRDTAVMHDLIRRVDRAGFNVLVVTVDIPIGAKRDREMKNGLILPFRLSAKLIGQALLRPQWSIKTLLNGIPDFVNLNPYLERGSAANLSELMSSFLMHGVTTDRLRQIRQCWQGPLVVKGLQRPEDIATVIDLGADGVIISNHAGRQLDAAPSSVQSLRMLPDDMKRKTVVMLDSGIRNGLDVIRARALGAVSCFSGRSFFYAVCGVGEDGGRQVIEIFRDEITRTLQQLGSEKFMELDGRWLEP